jgi:hypothetical protein
MSRSPATLKQIFRLKIRILWFISIACTDRQRRVAILPGLDLWPERGHPVFARWRPALLGHID